MICWLYEILKAQCEGNEKWLNFLEFHKKDIRFKSVKLTEIRFEIDNVNLKVDDELSIKRIANINVGAA